MLTLVLCSCLTEDVQPDNTRLVQLAGQPGDGDASPSRSPGFGERRIMTTAVGNVLPRC